jgi:hypothetical protein
MSPGLLQYQQRLWVKTRATEGQPQESDTCTNFCPLPGICGTLCLQRATVPAEGNPVVLYKKVWVVGEEGV